jgi:hypothetical protein
MSKVILVPINQLNLDYIRDAFKKAKADARKDKAVSTVEGGKQDDSKTA